MTWFQSLLASNEFLQGGLSLMLVGAVLAGIRYLPHILWEFVWRRFGVTVVVRDPTMVRWLGIWLSEQEFGRRTHWLEATSTDSKDGLGLTLRPGPGLHIFLFHNRRFYLYHEIEDVGLAGKINVLTLKVLRPDRGLVTDLMAEVVRRANHERVGRTPVSVNSRAYWELLRLIPKRPVETIFLKPGLLDEILRDASWFFNSEPWYRERGVPYRRGYLFHGEPGNGKSSLIQALAAYCDVSIYLVSFADKDFVDNELVRAMGNVPPKSLVLLEDFEKIDFKTSGVTMPGLLNAIDGPLASEGRILIMTANDISGLAPSILRPGRIDRRWHIGLPGPDAMDSCMSRFGVDGDRRSIASLASTARWSMADLQSHLWKRYGAKEG